VLVGAVGLLLLTLWNPVETAPEDFWKSYAWLKAIESFDYLCSILLKSYIISLNPTSKF